MQRVDHVSTLGLLVQELRDQSELGDDSDLQAALRDVVEMPPQVAHDAAGIRGRLREARHSVISRLAEARAAASGAKAEAVEDPALLQDLLHPAREIG